MAHALVPAIPVAGVSMPGPASPRNMWVLGPALDSMEAMLVEGWLLMPHWVSTTGTCCIISSCTLMAIGIIITMMITTTITTTGVSAWGDAH